MFDTVLNTPLYVGGGCFFMCVGGCFFNTFNPIMPGGNRKFTHT